MKKNVTTSKDFKDLPYVTEQLKVSKAVVKARINVLSGKESNDIWICYSSALNVSGYGETKKEAEESFLHNFELFAESLLKLKGEQQRKELRNLGWERQKYARKQFSKTYVDENGEIKNLKHSKLLPLETAA